MAKSGKGRREHGAKCLCCGKRHGDGAPWWYEAKSGWFITTGKSRRLLAKGTSVHDRTAHDEAIRKWKAGEVPAEQLIAPDVAVTTATGGGEDLTVHQLCDYYMAYLQGNATAKTYRQCRALFDDLCGHKTHGIGHMTVSQLRRDGVTRIKAWAKAPRYHKVTGKRTAGFNGSLATVYARIKAVFNHASHSDDNEESLNLIASNPISKLNTGKNRARHRTRKTMFSQEQIDAVLAYCEKSKRCPQFGLAFRALINTGCRPEEFCSVTAADVKVDEHGNTYWLVEHKNQKNTGERRRVYMLNKEMVDISRAQVELYPDGPLFRNGWGKRWTHGALLSQFRTICASEECRKLGLDECAISNQAEINKAKKNGVEPPKPRKEHKYVVYTTRHTFGYRWVNGYYGKELSYQRVADLMGNSATEVERTYGHAKEGTPSFVSALLGEATSG